MKHKLLKYVFSISLIITFYTGLSFAQPAIEWAQRYSDYPTLNKRVVDTKLDKAGNIYIAGYIENNDTSRIFLTLKYNSSGAFQWARTYNCLGGWDLPVGLCVDTLGNVYVTGRSDTVKSSDSLRIKFATIKYSSNGDLMWIKKFIDSDSIIAIPNSICIDDSMNIYITGHCYNFNPNGKAVIVKYDRNGKYIWAKTLSTSDRFEDFNNIFYKNNFIYLTGGASGSDTNTIKCNLNGDLIWEANFMTVGKKY